MKFSINGYCNFVDYRIRILDTKRCGFLLADERLVESC